MRNEMRRVLALALGFAVIPCYVAWADPSTAPVAAAKAAPSESSATHLPVGAALGDLKPADVRKLQSALQQMGHYRGDLDGVAGPATQAALAAFQREAQVSDGSVLDPTTQKALGVQVDPIREASPTVLENAGEDVRGVAASPKPVSAEATANRVESAAAESPETEAPVSGAEAPVPARFTLAELTRVQLEGLQRRLRTLGHYQGPIDGLDGPRTRQAFRDFFNHQLGLMTNHVQLTREGALALGLELTADGSTARAAEVPAVPEPRVVANGIPAPSAGR